jgi:hypothetical protein
MKCWGSRACALSSARSPTPPLQTPVYPCSSLTIAPSIALGYASRPCPADVASQLFLVWKTQQYQGVDVLQAAVYTDTQGVDVCNIVGADPLMDVPPCMNSAPLPLSAAASIPKFIYSTNSWLRRTQEACSPMLSTCLEHFQEELSNAQADFVHLQA